MLSPSLRRKMLPSGHKYAEEARRASASLLSPLRAMMHGDEDVLKTLRFDDIYMDVYAITCHQGDVLYRSLVVMLQEVAVAIRNTMLANIGQLSVSSFPDIIYTDVRIAIGDAILGTSVITNIASFLSIYELRMLAMNRSLRPYVSALLTSCRKLCPDSRSREELVSWLSVQCGIYKRGLEMTSNFFRFLDRNYCCRRQVSGVFQSGSDAMHEAVGPAIVVLGLGIGDNLDLVSLSSVVGDAG